MKKWLGALLAAVLVFALAACGGNKDENAAGGDKGGELVKLKVGASNVPHAEILEQAKPLLEEKGIDLEIITFQDYILPNKALADKDLTLTISNISRT